VIDDFLLLPTNQEEQHDLLILLRARDEDHTSTVSLFTNIRRGLA
jgi:hypothetical protein